MALDLSAAALVRAGSGLLLATFGLFVAFAGRAERRNIWFGVGLAAFGLYFVPDNLLADSTSKARFLGVAAIAAVAFVALAVAFWTDPRVAGRRAGAVVAGTVGGLLPQVVLALEPAGIYVTLARPPPESAFALVVYGLTFGLVLGVLLAWAFALRPAAGRAASPRDTALAFGLVLYPAYFAGFVVATTPVAVSTTRATALLVLSAALAVLGLAAIAFAWLLAGRVSAPRTGRDFAFVVLGTAFAAQSSVAFGLDPGTVGFGIVRIAAFGCLAYAVLRADLLGVPIPRLAERKGAIATVTLVGFFAVAQVAQEFLSGTMGVVLGGVAAGVLLFAAAPLQRAAERLASGERALAPTARPASWPDDHARQSYRLAVKAALADGSITRDEDVHLADLAQHLGIGAGDAVRLRHDVERELEGAR